MTTHTINTDTRLMVLRAVSDLEMRNDDVYGLDVLHEVEGILKESGASWWQRFGWQMGLQYTYLGDLESLGLVIGELDYRNLTVRSQRPRRRYTMTMAGKAALEILDSIDRIMPPVKVLNEKVDAVVEWVPPVATVEDLPAVVNEPTGLWIDSLEQCYVARFSSVGWKPALKP